MVSSIPRNWLGITLYCAIFIFSCQWCFLHALSLIWKSIPKWEWNVNCVRSICLKKSSIWILCGIGRYVFFNSTNPIKSLLWLKIFVGDLRKFNVGCWVVVQWLMLGLPSVKTWVWVLKLPLCASNVKVRSRCSSPLLASLLNGD